MGCSSCSSGKDGQPKGCKNNGTCGTDGCNKLTVFDWLSNMAMPNGVAAFDYVEVRFKNGRKLYFKNTENLPLNIGDVVATEASPGHDVGMVTLKGELVRIQMKKKGIEVDGEDTKRIYRKASQKDIDIWQKMRSREEDMKVRAREIAIRLELQMKISDIEFQGDGSKATFYYTAEDRVDFRQLIKDFAHEFSTRIEMRQIGFRQEAARLGGIGSCGRELCCSTWLSDFRSVTTSAARYQQLSLNPQKLAGQCGKLKCCLNYELDAYIDALDEFPKTETKLLTEKGTASCQKIDIFKGYMWYAYEGEWMNWHKLSIEHVNEIIAANEDGEKAPSLEEFAAELIDDNKLDFENVVGQDSLTRFDQPKKSNRKRRSRSRKATQNKSKQRNSNTGTNKQAPKKSNSSNNNSNTTNSKANTPAKNTRNKPVRKQNKPANKSTAAKEKKQQPKGQNQSQQQQRPKKKPTNTNTNTNNNSGNNKPNAKRKNNNRNNKRRKPQQEQKKNDKS